MTNKQIIQYKTNGAKNVNWYHSLRDSQQVPSPEGPINDCSFWYFIEEKYSKYNKILSLMSEIPMIQKFQKK